MNISPDQLRQIAPRAGASVQQIVDALNPAMRRFNIDTRQRVSHFIGQLAHESGHFTRVREGLNYSAEGLANTWPARFAKKDAAGKYLLTAAAPATRTSLAVAGGRKVPNELALNLHRRPEAIANCVYANRMGNGDEASGDGWKYAGAGWIQLTGKHNQLDCAEFFDIHPSVASQWLRTPTGAAMAAGWFWKVNNLNAHADVDDVDAVSDIINLGKRTEREGDAIGYEERLFLTQLAKKVLK